MSALYLSGIYHIVAIISSKELKALFQLYKQHSIKFLFLEKPRNWGEWRIPEGGSEPLVTVMFIAALPIREQKLGFWT